MGVLLRTLCGVNQWCYAVFWKFACQNPMLLILEECDFDPSSSLFPPRTSGIENTEAAFGDWEGYCSSSTHSSQVGMQAGSGIHMLISKMMSNQVNIVGEGIIGRAAFTGNHEWILTNSYVGETHPPEVLSEVHQQFSAGMQTIAVIPVCSHGVIQLGSSLAIMEDMSFVNNVKSLIMQLSCVPGALMSSNHDEKDSTERIGVPVSLGMAVSGHLSGNYKVPNSTLLVNQQSISSHTSKFGSQPFYSQVIHSWDNPQRNMFTNPNLTKPSAKSYDGYSEPKLTCKMKPDRPIRGQLESQIVEAEVIPANPNAWLNQQTASYNSGPGFSHHSVFGQSDFSNRTLAPLEQQILLDAGAGNHVDNNNDAPNNFVAPCSRTNGGIIRNSNGGSVSSGGERHPLLQQCKSADISSSNAHLTGAALQNICASKAKEFPLSCLMDQLSATGMLSGCSGPTTHKTDAKDVKNELTARKQVGNSMFQYLDVPLIRPDARVSLGNPDSGSAHDCLKHASRTQTAITVSSKNEDPCIHPASGNDLYDIFGVDFKNKLLNRNSKNLGTDGLCAKTQDTDKDSSTFLDLQEAISDFYSVGNEMSDSGIFSSMGTDNLLDAVVSRAHSMTKLSSDDSISCRTTLTKISSSSVSCPLTNGHIGMPDKLQRDFFNLPKTLEKAATTASGSFKSGSSKDDIGSCSQTTSIYGSELSTWVGHNAKHDSSVSTAFSKKTDEVSKSNRKRLKPGENPRPRPKDRQMIQDRVKELREIVPNGAKCSIDALLERTIKHMLFLQSVTKHADKLKQTGDSKIINKDGGLLLKDNFEGGATWAFEVGSQSMVCPIIVEDLNQPRQMLVEMLCEEQGFFLEIADLIRGLGLTILKGVMEARNDKIWARFVVEANRDVTRMEIFMSLVRLLEQTVKGSTSSANALENNNMMVHHAFPQATPITATGRPSSLQ